MIFIVISHLVMSYFKLDVTNTHFHLILILILILTNFQP
ncbi:Uncharacterised protein [Legionella pneumophila subsp. pascullei]|uniref:Uncharacterized protein n=1 Tax=Legionella pneumophila subsp. pascullei TaxID=91890 RepID=A0AAX2IW37_LEGPN|nr:Uncharacterised protein [Legionella pneumophila subsp. pascullei]VEH05968.1 Uncharacterised protein [Legionella pneumophila subsp. pascullei]